MASICLGRNVLKHGDSSVTVNSSDLISFLIGQILLRFGELSVDRASGPVTKFLSLCSWFIKNIRSIFEYCYYETLYNIAIFWWYFTLNDKMWDTDRILWLLKILRTRNSKYWGSRKPKLLNRFKLVCDLWFCIFRIQNKLWKLVRNIKNRYFNCICNVYTYIDPLRMQHTITMI